MTALRRSVELEMRLRGLSSKTHESYLHAIEQLARFHWRSPDELSCAEVQSFLDHLITDRKLSWSTVNVYFSACRFLYEQVLKRSREQFSIPPRGRSRTRPGVLSRQEVMRLLAAPRNLKHRALLSITYGSGLRVSEAVAVRISDLDRDRMMLKVTGKGHKDRYTILAMHSLKLLEQHWLLNHPPCYFFFGRDITKPMSVATAQCVYYQALERSGVRRVGGIHTLRHCFASHAMEDGHDVFSIKRWLGHSALITTGQYVHLAPPKPGAVSPLDNTSAEA